MALTQGTEFHTAGTAIRFGTRARFGLIMPSGNSVAEGELAAILPRDISLHVTRLRLSGRGLMPEGAESYAKGIFEHFERAQDHCLL